MKIYFKDIPEDGLFLEGRVSVEKYDFPVDKYKNWKDVEYKLTAQILDKECLVMGSISTKMKVACARCLEDLPLEIKVEKFEHSYQISSAMEYIDLTEDIREDILLDLPLAPKCQLAADFRCPVTGKSYTEQEGEFEVLNRESVWGILDTLKPKSPKKTQKKKRK